MMHFLQYRHAILSSVSLACLLACSPVVFAADPLSPRVEVSAKGGNKRSILSTQIWAPLAQRDDRVLYADVRLMGDNDENREGNFGLGYREINPYTNTVIGFHGWYDQRRTENDSTFRQLTFGAESLGHVWDMRVNGYVPLNKSRTLGSTGTSDPYLAGTGIFYDINGFLVETPQYGVDGEIGYRLPILQKQADAIRVYGGGYHFFRDNTDNVTGFRVRTEAQVTSAFSLGARYQYDEPRGSQGFLEATIRFPFGAKKLYQTEGLRSRLDESAERDIDIVTSAKVAPGQKGVAVVNEAGTQQRILYVDNTAATGGDGSLDNPFSTLKDAEAALRAHDILYVYAGDGGTTGMDQGIVIDKANITLIGSGSDLSYAGHTLIAAGLAPVITNTETPIDSTDLYTGNGVLVTGANGLISGITVDGAAYMGIRGLADGHNLGNFIVVQSTANNNNAGGITAQAINNGHFERVLFSGNSANTNQSTVAAGNGIVIASARNNMSPAGSFGTVIVANNQLEDNTGNGISIYAPGTISNLTLDSNDIHSNDQHGISLVTQNNATVNTHLINNSVTDSILSGIYVMSQNDSILSVHATSNTITSNQQRGLSFVSQNNSLLNATVNDNILANNQHHGLYIASQNYSGTNATVTGNTIQNNQQHGHYIISQNDSALNANILNNTISGNQQVGLILVTQNNSTSNTSFIGNTIEGNQRHGFYALSSDNSSLTTAVSSTSITNNGDGTTNYYGIRLDHDSTGVFNIDFGGGTLNSAGGNSIHSNIYRDIFIDSRPGTDPATPGTTISAQRNWWGDEAGLDQGARVIFDNGSATPGSSIDAGNHLTSDPAI